MEERMEENNKTVKCEEEKNQISKELEEIRKRQKFLKILAYVLIAVIFVSFAVFYTVYSNYKKIQNSIQTAIENPETQAKLEEFAKKMEEMSQSVTVSTHNQQSSLSMIVFSSEAVSSLTNEEKRKEMEEVAKDFTNDENVKKFMETFKNDPELKEIFESNDKDKPVKLMKKMQDPKFMQKMTNILLSNPEMMQSLIKMSTDPRMQNIMKSAPEEIKKIKVSTQTK